jgi:iron(III) transport system substrate-binding protein
MKSSISRRNVLKGTGAVLAGAAFSTRVMAAAPPEPVTPDLIEAAKKEGQIIYTSTDLPVAEAGQGVRSEISGDRGPRRRTGRNVPAHSQEYASNIHAVDVVNSSDAAHFIVWKRDGILAPYVTEDVAKFYPDEHRDTDEQFASFRVWLSIIAYNTNLVKTEDAPKSFADLLDPKWKGKIVKAHPGYSGTIMTATYQMQRDLGWTFFEQLAKQNIMQVQSSADPPKKLDLGERAVMADGNEYNIFQMKEAGRPVEPVYATEGSPLIIGPNGVFKDAPHPKAARLFQSFSLSREAQQLIIDVGGLRSVHSQTVEKAGRKPLKDIKTMKDDAAAVEKESDSIKARYTKIFRV